MKISTKQKRLLRTASDEVESLSDTDAFELLTLMFQGLGASKGTADGMIIPEISKQILEPLLKSIEDLDGEDCFGTEGWQRGIFGVDL